MRFRGRRPPTTGLWFDWSWTRNKEPAGNIGILTERDAIVLIYRSRPYGCGRSWDWRNRSSGWNDGCSNDGGRNCAREGRPCVRACARTNPAPNAENAPVARREVAAKHCVWHYRTAMTAIASTAGMMLRCGE
jgi:hypothetical protein